MFNASSRIVAAAHPMCRDEGETETEQKLPPLYPPTACSCIRCFWHWGTSVHRPLFPVVLAKFAIQVACLYFLCVPPINPAFLARFVKWLRTPFFTRYFLSMLLSFFLYFFQKEFEVALFPKHCLVQPQFRNNPAGAKNAGRRIIPRWPAGGAFSETGQFGTSGSGRHSPNSLASSSAVTDATSRESGAFTGFGFLA